MTDPLAAMFVHQVTLRRLTGGGDDGLGSTLADPETLTGWINDRNRLVRAPSGDQVVSSTQVATSSTVGYVLPGSQVTLPATFGGRTARVIGCEIADSGGLGLPDHAVLLLE